MNNKIIALVLLVVGIGLIIWGYQMSDSMQSQLSESLSGSMPDEVMWRYIGGAVCVVVGGFMLKK